MFDKKLTIDLSRVGNDIPTRLGKVRPMLTCINQITQFNFKIYVIRILSILEGHGKSRSYCIFRIIIYIHYTTHVSINNIKAELLENVY